MWVNWVRLRGAQTVLGLESVHNLQKKFDAGEPFGDAWMQKYFLRKGKCKGGDIEIRKVLGLAVCSTETIDIWLF
jgi:hypothetical protein